MILNSTHLAIVDERELFLKTSLYIPKLMAQHLTEEVIKNGYGMRGKNKWLCEKLDNFLNFSPDDYVEMVEASRPRHGEIKQNVLLTMRFPVKFENRIENMIEEIRQVYPHMEAVRSNIIRASIIQGLLR
jgi:hypothetical protein